MNSKFCLNFYCVLFIFAVLGNSNTNAGQLIDEISTGRNCQSDPVRTLEDLEREGKLLGSAVHSKIVPKGLLIDPRRQAYIVINPTEVRSLPSKNIGGTLRYLPPHADVAICKVRTNDKTWWYVERSPKGYLLYINSNDVIGK